MKSSSYISLKPLILARQAQRPMDCDRLFGRTAPVQVEIGFGNGEFLVKTAKSRPDNDFIGIEFKWARVRKTLKKLAHSGVRNVRLVYGDARFVFDRLMAPRLASSIYSLFPCPWPKRRHERHRLFSYDFLRLINSRLVAKGKFWIITDHLSFRDWIIDRVSDTGFHVSRAVIEPRYDTKYEKKWMRSGQKEFYEISFEKTRHEDILLKKEAALRTFCLDHFDPKKFVVDEVRGDITITPKEFMYDPRIKKGMVKMLVAEENLVQNVWVKILWDKDKWRIMIDNDSGAVATEGLKKALELVYEAAMRTRQA